MEQVRKRPSIFKRTMFVDHKTQLAILSYSLLVALMTVFLTGIFFLTIQYASAMLESSGSNFTYFLIIGLLWFVSLLGLTLVGVILTHRIAGPIYRLRKNMQEVATGGTIEAVVFRKGDHFFDLADDYNRVLERLRKAESR